MFFIKLSILLVHDLFVEHFRYRLRLILFAFPRQNIFFSFFFFLFSNRHSVVTATGKIRHDIHLCNICFPLEYFLRGGEKERDRERKAFFEIGSFLRKHRKMIKRYVDYVEFVKLAIEPKLNVFRFCHVFHTTTRFFALVADLNLELKHVPTPPITKNPVPPLAR